MALPAPSAPTAPSANALDVCSEVVEQWKAVHCPGVDLGRETLAVSGRVASWLCPTSVLAGVGDVFCASRLEGQPLSDESIGDLGERMAKRLVAEGLLLAQARRGGLLST